MLKFMISHQLTWNCHFRSVTPTFAKPCPQMTGDTVYLVTFFFTVKDIYFWHFPSLYHTATNNRCKGLHTLLWGTCTSYDMGDKIHVQYMGNDNRWTVSLRSHYHSSLWIFSDLFILDHHEYKIKWVLS